MEKEIVPPVVASVWREIVPNYTVRDVFSAKREEVRQRAAGLITQKLAADGIVVKEVMLRDIQLPPQYAEGLETLLLKEQENDRMGIETELKNKEVRIAELEAEAMKARQVKMAEGSIEIIAPEQAHDAPTQPQAFGIGRGPSQQPLGLGKFVDLFLGLLGISGRWLLLIRRLLLIILGKCRIGDEHHRRAEGGGHKTHPEALHVCPDCWAIPVGRSPCHGDPFGQHCGDGHWCDPIKAAD